MNWIVLHCNATNQLPTKLVYIPKNLQNFYNTVTLAPASKNDFTVAPLKAAFVLYCCFHIYSPSFYVCDIYALLSLCHQVVLGGGQEAMDVTTTSTKIGKFDARFYHLVFEEEFGRVKGHFGPINSTAFHPDGKR